MVKIALQVGGWAGAGCADRLPLLLEEQSLLYIGGMFLNDAFDATFDRQYRTERPIPSGAVKERTVWLCGLACIALGVAALF